MTWYEVAARMQAAAAEKPFPWLTLVLGLALAVDILWFIWLNFQGESMKMYKTTAIMTFFLLACALMFGCATVAGVQTDAKAAVTAIQPAVDQSSLQANLTTDLTAAITRAEAAKDVMAPQRAICYKTLLSLVPTLPSLPTLSGGNPAGVFDAFEVGAEAAESVSTVADYQLPADVRAKITIDCGPLEARANDLLTRFNVKIALIAGKIGLLAK